MNSPYPSPHPKSVVSLLDSSNQALLSPTEFSEPTSTMPEKYEEADQPRAEVWQEIEEEFDREKLWAGKIMVDDTRQFKWIVYLKNGIEICFADRDDIFVAGDLLWLPDENDATVRLIPDAMVVVGRPPHDRSSYKQWEEENIPPQVVFEVISPSNNAAEMQKKRNLYEKYGVEEFYLYEPMENELSGYARGKNGTLEWIGDMEGWKSPRLRITFRSQEEGLRLYTPEQEPILSALELAYARKQAVAREQAERQARKQAETAQQQAEAAQQQAEAARQQAEVARQQAEAAQQQAEAARQQAEAEKQAEQEARQQAEKQLEQLQRELAILRQQSKHKKKTDG